MRYMRKRVSNMQIVVKCLAKYADKEIESRIKRGWFVMSLTTYGCDNSGMIIVFEKRV